MPETKEWNNEQLVEYVSLFRDNQREYVLKQILESELLEKFLGTTEGRLILGNVVDSITADTIKIITLSIGDASETTKKDNIYAAAQRIKVAYNFMYNLAAMAVKGKEHTEIIKKKR